MSDFLSPGTLTELTGTPQKSRQLEWLRKNGWRFAQDRFGAPKVAKAYYERRMVGVEQSPAPKGDTQPNWAALGI